MVNFSANVTNNLLLLVLTFTLRVPRSSVMKRVSSALVSTDICMRIGSLLLSMRAAVFTCAHIHQLLLLAKVGAYRVSKQTEPRCIHAYHTRRHRTTVHTGAHLQLIVRGHVRDDCATHRLQCFGLFV